MISPQVEVTPSSPFGCVNRRDACSTTHAAFQKNMVEDNINISDSAPKNDSKNPTNKIDTWPWVSRVAKNDNLRNLSFTDRLHNIKKDESSLSALVSPRHSKVIDRWAATARQHAQKMATTLENNKVEVKDKFPSRSSSFNSRKEVSPTRSNGSFESEISNLGASFLVRIWEKRLKTQSNNCTKPNASDSPRRTSSDASSNENAVSVEEQCMVLEEGDRTLNEESFPDWEEYNKTRLSDQSCSSPKISTLDVAENERGRVAYIIKRLTDTNQMRSSEVLLNDDNDHELCSSVTGSPYRERGSPYRERDPFSKPKQQEHRAFAHVISSPRIRGRQAFNDLLMQFESNRHGELNNLARRGAVSKFTQRGRIQSLLRLRLLQRGIAVFDLSGQKPAASEVNRQQGSSAIMQLRERFNTGNEPRTPSLVEKSNPRSPNREIVSTGMRYEKPTRNFVSKTSVNSKAHPSSDVTFRGTFFGVKNYDPKETIRTSSSMVDSNANYEMVHKAVTNDRQGDTTEINYDEMAIEEEVSDQQYAASSYDYTVEEEEVSNQHYDETSYDWTSHISRPRSYWEERRQEWYREKLDFSSANDEIRKLLERKTVSTLLSSGFHERLERLMKSHMGTKSHLISSQCDEEDQEGSMDQLMAFFQEHLHFRSKSQEDGMDRVQEEEERRNEEEEAEEKSIISGSDHEGDYFNHSSSSLHAPSPSSWSYRDNDAGDDSDRLVSMSSPPTSHQSQSFYQDNRQYSSSINHHSIEMEFIYELRGQMDQLFHEMSELRKSIKCCMDMQMQMQLQQSKNQEVHTEEEKKFHNRTPKKGNCCICNEKKVNSLLYRCGHMCACFKCANELQWNSGKCPKCQSPIIDVVRVYADTESSMVGMV
ncbi:uncharacterized protein LOC113855868 [Abrus precatorius]|uniref:Uncharacterized protein LOC113855868 n=1 Tax=Abrus precatorius TaxID=3816 RepID=A0A8B8KKC5_ABRPR|nr:uncharacterized protein LOC113855868 [Abrus precatorius]